MSFSKERPSCWTLALRSIEGQSLNSYRGSFNSIKLKLIFLVARKSSKTSMCSSHLLVLENLYFIMLPLYVLF